ncbi:MAG: KdsC family phosphatase [Betaproteobacteria bacterium]
MMIFDVDGVLTDGTLWYGEHGDALKAFHAFDGHGMKMLAAHGVPCALLSGRRSAAVSARAAELGVGHVLQGINDKRAAFEALLAREGLAPEAAGYMGDEFVDLPVLTRCGFACAPREAPEAVRSRVHYVAAAPAGRGAVREVCEVVLQAQGALERALQGYLA